MINYDEKCIVYIVIEERFLKSKDGRYCSPSGFGKSFWGRYLEVFDKVVIVGRVSVVGDFPPNAILVNDERISFYEIPYYQGPVEYLRKIAEIKQTIRCCADKSGSFILRLPGVLGGQMSYELQKRDRSYGVELIGDPKDVFSKGGVGGVAKMLFKYLFVRATKRACARADAVAYVTKDSLQKRYPISKGKFQTHYSSIELSEKMFLSTVRDICQLNEIPFKIMLVGSMEQLYKGFDVMIKAMGILRGERRQLIVVIAGDGIYRHQLEKQAAKEGVAKYIDFLGRIPRIEVFKRIDKCNLFVMSSRTEGLPRALIEAMARGVPCLGSNVGGIPELLEPKYLCPPGDAYALANAIARLIDNPDERRVMSERNLRVANAYRSDVLQKRRTAFYTAVRTITHGSVKK